MVVASCAVTFSWLGIAYLFDQDSNSCWSLYTACRVSQVRVNERKGFISEQRKMVKKRREKHILRRNKIVKNRRVKRRIGK